MSGWHMRAHRRIKIAPGVHLNLGKRSTSISLGPRGAHFTIGTRGTRTSVGIPGTGLGMYRQRSWGHHRQSGPSLSSLSRIPVRIPKARKPVPYRPPAENWFVEHSSTPAVSPAELSTPVEPETHAHSATGCLAVLGLFVGIILGATYVWPLAFPVIIGALVLDVTLIRMQYHHRHLEPATPHGPLVSAPTATSVPPALPSPPAPPSATASILTPSPAPPASPSIGGPVPGWNPAPAHHPHEHQDGGPVPGWNPEARRHPRPHQHPDPETPPPPVWGQQ